MAPAAGSRRRSGARIEFSKYRATRGNAVRRQMHQFEQFRPRLLLGGVDVLIAVDDVDVDGELARRGG